MEQTYGSNSVPSGPIIKSTVLTVKPLRCLIPVFPSKADPSAPPSSQFASVPPSGPFPPGTSPFFPFFASNESQRPAHQERPYPIPSPVPHRRKMREIMTIFDILFIQHHVLLIGSRDQVTQYASNILETLSLGMSQKTAAGVTMATLQHLHHQQN